MNVVVSHVYSGSNGGDGLLARLSARLVEEALGVEPTLLVLDPEGFGEHPRVVFGQRPRSPGGVIRESMATVGLGSTAGQRLLAAADLVVAVGGAYLRSDGLRSTAVTTGVHVTQLLQETRCRGRAIFLPQSVGPLPVALREVVRARLGRAGAVFVRDDRSAHLLRGLGNVTRMADLAALEIGRPSGAHRPNHQSGPAPDRRLLLQLRPLPAEAAWAATVHRFVLDSPLPVDAAVHSVAGAGNDDREFTVGVTGTAELPLLNDTLAESSGRHAVAVCGRLHAALACILAGVPAFHVAYERKSYGVYADLGLSEYLLQPAELTTPAMTRRIVDVADDPSPYWDALESARPALAMQRDELVAHMRRLAA